MLQNPVVVVKYKLFLSDCKVILLKHPTYLELNHIFSALYNFIFHVWTMDQIKKCIFKFGTTSGANRENRLVDPTVGHIMGGD